MKINKTLVAIITGLIIGSLIATYTIVTSQTQTKYTEVSTEHTIDMGTIEAPSEDAFAIEE